MVGAFDKINGSRLSLKCINVTNKNVKNGAFKGILLLSVNQATNLAL